MDFSLKEFLYLLVQLTFAAVALSLLLYVCAQIAGFEWLNPLRAFGIVLAIFVLALVARVVRYAFAEAPLG